MRSTFFVFHPTWAWAGLLVIFLGCSQGEGDRCEVDSDCEGDLICSHATGSPHNGICRPQSSGTVGGGSTGQGASTRTAVSTSTSTDTSVTMADAGPTPAHGPDITDASVADVLDESDATVDSVAMTDDGF